MASGDDASRPRGEVLAGLPRSRRQRPSARREAARARVAAAATAAAIVDAAGASSDAAPAAPAARPSSKTPRAAPAPRRDIPAAGYATPRPAGAHGSADPAAQLAALVRGLLKRLPI